MGGFKDVKQEVSALRVKIKYCFLLVIYCMISSMDDEVLGLTHGTGFGIKLDFNESTSLGYSEYSSKWSGANLIQGLFICWRLWI